MNQCPALMRLLDKIAEHLLGDFEVGNNPVLITLILPGARPSISFASLAHRLYFPSAVVKSNG
jgi:hypothetical protein